MIFEKGKTRQAFLALFFQEKKEPRGILGRACPHELAENFRWQKRLPQEGHHLPAAAFLRNIFRREGIRRFFGEYYHDLEQQEASPWTRKNT